MYSWFLALRYLLTRRVNLLGVLGLAVAVWALIVVIGVMSGFIGEIRESVKNASPDVLITGLPEGCDYSAVRPLLAGDPDVDALTPRVEHYAMLHAYGKLLPRFVQTVRPIETGQLGRNFVRLIGVDVEAEQRMGALPAWLAAVEKDELRVEDPSCPFHVSRGRIEAFERLDAMRPGAAGSGRLLRSDDGVLLSFRRVDRGEPVRPGQRIDLVTARFVRDAEGDSRVVHGRWPTVMSGTFHTGHRTFDESVVLVDIEFLRRALGYGADESEVELCTQVAIKARPGTDLTALADRLRQALHASPIAAGEALTWERQSRTFLSAVDRERENIKIALFAVMLVAGFLIYATLHMMVTQKVRDIGILSALGATGSGIQAIFVLCGLVIAVIGCAVGLGAGLLSALWLNPINDFCRRSFGVELLPTNLYALDQVPVRLDPGWISQVAVAAAILALLVAWMPARRAARLHPVQALSES